jgi:AraC family ethanolamine operon transcriptional activator
MSERSAPALQTQLTTRECLELNTFSDLNGWETDYQQLGRGVFESSFKIYRTEHLSVTDQVCNREMGVSGVPPVGAFPLFLILNQGDRGIYNGKPLQLNEVFVLRPGSEGTFRSPADLRMINLQVPESRLRQALSTMTGDELDALVPDTRRLILPAETISDLTSIAERVLSPRLDPTIARPPNLWLREAEEYLVTTLVSGLTQSVETHNGVGLKKRMKYVATARDYIEANLTSPLGLETVAQQTGVSLRTLETSFREFLDTTPLRYIKTRRLHAARRRLREATAGELSVTKIANDCGFEHLSYFARDYKALFDESPSETLRG